MSVNKVSDEFAQLILTMALYKKNVYKSPVKKRLEDAAVKKFGFKNSHEYIGIIRTHIGAH